MDHSQRSDDFQDSLVSSPRLRYFTRQFLCRNGVAPLCRPHRSRTSAISATPHQSLFIFQRVQVDGYLARKYDMGSVLGSILDPAADKALMTTLVVALTLRGLVPCMYMHARSLHSPADPPGPDLLSQYRSAS